MKKRLKKILIANRGEIAVRIIRACREMGITTVAVYSDADRSALHVRLADEAYHIGHSEASASYLNIQNILDAARWSRSEAIAPGYGFLAENAEFARHCEEAGLIFIGPSPESIELMGEKVTSRKIALEAGLPLIPGVQRRIDDPKEAVSVANKLGYPVMLKASAGGGGKGMRMAKNPEEVKQFLPLTMSEAQASFGDDTIYMEKFIENPRHVEIQILGDNYGNVIYLGERECSLQRRHQKVVEESPSPITTPELRKNMGTAAVKLAKKVGYRNAGTVEFLVDKDRNFYFLEMNTRLQVEHPVTEMVTGIDIVKAQLRIAAGEKLWLTQDQIKINGWAMECRIYAEDPENNFTPCPGKITSLHEPSGPGIRNDNGMYEGLEITIYYDPLISKLIAYGADRTECIHRMLRALKEFKIGGIKTNIPYFTNILMHPEFRAGNFDTSFLMNKMNGWHYEYLAKNRDKLKKVALIASAIDYFKKEHPKTFSCPKRASQSPWKLNGRVRNMSK